MDRRLAWLGASVLAAGCSGATCSHSAFIEGSSCDMHNPPGAYSGYRLVACPDDDQAFLVIGTGSRFEGSDLELFDMNVKFGRGKPWDVPIRHYFKEGSRSRLIDLPGDRRFIKRVDFRYGNLPGGGKARVQLWGK